MKKGLPLTDFRGEIRSRTMKGERNKSSRLGRKSSSSETRKIGLQLAPNWLIESEKNFIEVEKKKKGYLLKEYHS